MSGDVSGVGDKRIDSSSGLEAAREPLLAKADKFDASAVARLGSQEPARPSERATADDLRGLSEKLSQLRVSPLRLGLAIIVGLIGAVGTGVAALLSGPVAVAPGLVTLVILRQLLFSESAVNDVIKEFAQAHNIAPAQAKKELDEWQKTGYAINATRRAANDLLGGVKEKIVNPVARLAQDRVAKAEQHFAKGNIGVAKTALTLAQKAIDAVKQNERVITPEMISDDCAIAGVLLNNLRERYNNIEIRGGARLNQLDTDLKKAELQWKGIYGLDSDHKSAPTRMSKLIQLLLDVEKKLEAVEKEVSEGQPVSDVRALTAGVTAAIVVSAAQIAR